MKSTFPTLKQWENKNANWLLKEDAKKETVLRRVADEEITFTQTRINHRPKRYLGFKQHAVIFKAMALATSLGSIALQT
ncbi:hypothetical protein [Candidatus Enterovibrio escicola]|uniref:hypothetical protein n=1 Tax=Candidatus Enterovibrio escicola TaxID=1927127 RepID=UPI001CC24124|nr:hypothetical protein [Candidatus Enterovibrio escacola]